MTSEHLKHSGAEGVDVHGDGKTFPLFGVVLLYWCVAWRSLAYRSARLGIAIGCILLGIAEVYEHGVTMTEHHIGRFEVEMQHFVVVHEREGCRHLTRVAQRVGFGQTAFADDEVVKTSSVKICHRVIDGVVFRPRLSHTYDVGMMKL